MDTTRGRRSAHAAPADDVVVVVVTWNSEAVIGAALAALPAALEGITRHRTVVVDNASSDGTATIVAATSPDAVLCQTGRNAGYAAACNVGITEAGSDASAVLLLNADVRPGPGSIHRLLQVLAADPAVGIVVPRLTDGAGRTSPSLRRDPSVGRALGEALLGGRRAGRHARLGEVVADPGRYTMPGPVDWASGAALLLGRRCLDEVAPLDESFFLYSEEVDLAQRTRDRGLVVVYEPDAVMAHDGGAVHDDAHLWTLCTTNRVRLYARRHDRVRTAAFWAAVALGELLRAPRHPRHAAALRALADRPWLTGHQARPAVSAESHRMAEGGARR